MLAKDLPKSGISLFTYNCQKKEEEEAFILGCIHNPSFAGLEIVFFKTLSPIFLVTFVTSNTKTYEINTTPINPPTPLLPSISPARCKVGVNVKHFRISLVSQQFGRL